MEHLSINLRDFPKLNCGNQINFTKQVGKSVAEGAKLNLVAACNEFKEDLISARTLGIRALSTLVFATLMFS